MPPATFEMPPPIELTPTTPKAQLLEAYGTTTWFKRIDTRSQSPIIDINPTRIYGPIGPEWTTTRQIITVIVKEIYWRTYIKDEPDVISMNVRPTGYILTPPVSAF